MHMHAHLLVGRITSVLQTLLHGLAAVGICLLAPLGCALCVCLGLSQRVACRLLQILRQYHFIKRLLEGEFRRNI